MNSPNGRLTILNRNFAGRLVAGFAVAALLASPLLMAQTVGTGSIVGMVTDPQAKSLAGAKVEIMNKTRAGVIHVTTSAAGLYSSGPIQPGDYVVRVGVKGFNPTALTVVVQVGNTTRADVTMRVGTEKPQGEVPGGTAVNVEQATVQSVVNGEQIESCLLYTSRCV